AGVNFSTQLLNERLEVQGNLGVNTGLNTAKNYYVSDVKLEYKLTPDGRIRLKAYNITNDVSTLTANGLYTQGVGIAYRREFDKLRDAFHKHKASTTN
ncbi:MAG: translocation/assembly module TamB domain-containing protein, partial [Bacteroidia bacterium]